MRILSLFLSVLTFFSNLALAEAPRIALILDKGGKDDKSFNSAAYRGGMSAKDKLGIFLKYIEVGDDTLYEPAIRSFASKNFDLIIAIGVSQAEVVKKLAKEMPNQKFAIIDGKVEAPNVASFIFTENEGSYLVGYIAGMKSKTGKVGFIGGMQIPLIRRFEIAYVQGVKAASPKAEVQVNYIGVGSDSWNNPTKAKELAKHQFEGGADIIFSVAGASNAGAIDAAASEGKFLIGVDSNQNGLKPGTVLTSMVKHVDKAVFDVIEQLKNGKFQGGVRMYDLKSDGVNWAYDENNKSLFTDKDLKIIQSIQGQIANGKIKVVDYYKTRGA